MRAVDVLLSMTHLPAAVLLSSSLPGARAERRRKLTDRGGAYLRSVYNLEPPSARVAEVLPEDEDPPAYLEEHEKQRKVPPRFNLLGEAVRAMGPGEVIHHCERAIAGLTLLADVEGNENASANLEYSRTSNSVWDEDEFQEKEAEFADEGDEEYDLLTRTAREHCRSFAKIVRGKIGPVLREFRARTGQLPELMGKNSEADTQDFLAKLLRLVVKQVSASPKTIWPPLQSEEVRRDQKKGQRHDAASSWVGKETALLANLLSRRIEEAYPFSQHAPQPERRTGSEVESMLKLEDMARTFSLHSGLAITRAFSRMKQKLLTREKDNQVEENAFLHRGLSFYFRRSTAYRLRFAPASPPVAAPFSSFDSLLHAGESMRKLKALKQIWIAVKASEQEFIEERSPGEDRSAEASAKRSPEKAKEAHAAWWKNIVEGVELLLEEEAAIAEEEKEGGKLEDLEEETSSGDPETSSRGYLSLVEKEAERWLAEMEDENRGGRCRRSGRCKRLKISAGDVDEVGKKIRHMLQKARRREGLLL